AFDDAVRVALEFARSDSETLVIATADHETGGLQAEMALSSVPAQKGTQRLSLEHSPESVLLLSWSDTGHTSQDVPLMAFGPMAEQVTDARDNTDIFRIMANAWGIEAVVVAVPTAQPTPTATPAPSLSELCTPVEPFASGRGNVYPNNDGVLKIGLTGHANLWWKGETLAGNTNVERAGLVGEFLNSQQVDFSVWLGDDFRLCDEAEVHDYARSIEGFEQAVYKLVGNHDLDENPRQLIDPLQRERYAALFGRDIYWYVDTQDYRLVFLADESAQGASYISDEQIAFLSATLDSSPYPVLVFAHHVLPIRSRELINAMIGKHSLNTNKILNIVNESGKVVFWGWGQHHSKGRNPTQANGIVEYTPHFLTGYVDGGAVNSLETSVLTLSDGTLTIEVFDTFTSTRTQFFSFNLPEPSN
ncbi:MAG: alkaline phosphatase, partial [Chloroflexi bacterium]|nr:alkaline phosphatase [Chloroflexota bacterium]